MNTPISVTLLRQQLYNIIDRIIETGIPQEIIRKNHMLKISLEDQAPQTKEIDKFKLLKPHNAIIGNPEDLANLKVSKWNEENTYI